MGSSLADRRVVVIGASAGIGRSFAISAIRNGAEVIAVARRSDRLATMVEEAGGGTALAADIAEPAGVRRISDAAAASGGIDLLVYSAGSAPLQWIADTTTDTWDAVLRTNVVGFNEVVRAVLSDLSPDAVVVALSSETVGQPRQALTAYAASRAALEASIRGWRIEQPGRRFCCVRVGATQPTEFGDAFAGDVLGPALDQWAVHGLMQEEFMHTDDVAAVLVDTMAVLLAHPGVAMEDVVLRSPSPVVGSATPAITHARATSARGSDV